MKNPFSIYDFLGYLFPGSVFLVLIGVIIYDYENFPNAEVFKDFLIFAKDYKFSLESSFLFVIIAYVMGHVIAYLSSLCVEGFSNKVFGYPTKYLLGKSDYRWRKLVKSYFDTNASDDKKYSWLKFIIRVFKLLMRLFIAIILFPITSSVYTFGYLLEINEFITRPLDQYLRDAITAKIKNLITSLGIKENGENEDYHRLIMHYALINIPESQQKVNNYIALYGFLRAMAMLACLLSDYLMVKALLSINFGSPADWPLIICTFISFVMAYILFMGFVKFYRRTTLEDFMAIVVEKNHETKNKGERGFHISAKATF